jgi:DNA-3-methyladenine glycosylase II
MKYEIDLYPTPPYDFQRSFSFLKARPDPMDRFDGEIFQRIWSLENKQWAFLSLFSVGTIKSPRLLLILESDFLTDETVGGIIRQIETVYCLNLDLSVFHDAIKKEIQIFTLTQNFLGMKPALEPNLFEALVWAITGQQVNLAFACAVKTGMLARYGERISLKGEVFYRHPDPEDLANLNPTEWRAFKSSARKAEYIIGLAKMICNGFDLEALRHRTDDEIVAHLTTLRGIGRWTAEYALIRGLGRWDTLPATDAGLINGVRRAYELDHRPSTEEIVTIGERWRPWRGLATYYLWWAK